MYWIGSTGTTGCWQRVVPVEPIQYIHVSAETSTGPSACKADRPDGDGHSPPSNTGSVDRGGACPTTPAPGHPWCSSPPRRCPGRLGAWSAEWTAGKCCADQ